MPVQLLDLPLEIIIAIISQAEPPDVHCLRLANKQLRDIVQNSPLIQYGIECYVAGINDNPQARTPYPDRLDLLRQRASRWQSLTPINTINIHIPFNATGVYDLVGGNIILGVGDNVDGTYAFMPLPPVGDTSAQVPDWKFFSMGETLIDFGLSAHESDLIAVVTE